MQNLLQNFPLAINVRVRVRIKFWQNAHVRAMCVRPKIECANVRACEAKNRRNSQRLVLKHIKIDLSRADFHLPIFDALPQLTLAYFDALWPILMRTALSVYQSSPLIDRFL